jgi:hypothetical protein
MYEAEVLRSMSHPLGIMVYVKHITNPAYENECQKGGLNNGYFNSELYDKNSLSRDNSVVIAMGLRAGRQEFDSLEARDFFLFSTSSRPALGPTQPAMQWVLSI